MRRDERAGCGAVVARLVGRTSAERSVRVAPAILAKYAGVYDTERAADFGIRTLTVSLSEGQLSIDLNGKGRLPLVPLSETMFSPRLLGTYEFIVGERGTVTHLLAHSAEGFSRRFAGLAPIQESRSHSL